MKRKTFVRIQEAVVLIAAVNFLAAPVMLYIGVPLIGFGNFGAAIGLIVLVDVTNRWERRTTWDRIREEFTEANHDR